MFSKILIANRGEIACRIIDSCRRLGVASVAVYSSADAGARHVAMADEALPIGGPAPADSYLRGAALIEAALASGAQAIHPGYGFLSENPDFVEAVEAAGLVFIGPSAAAIRAMGLKDAAKALMEKAGVPVVPGYHGADQDPLHLARAAADIGYPVLIKAVAGGGGKGMRRVEAPEDFAQALQSARREAEGAFGNGAVLIEKYVDKPRHIEVQVFGDGRDAVHLFERDCSLQRRHQKVIEEAPAPGMTAAMRQAMGEAAVRAARTIGYRGAGTIEFIVDASAGLRPDRFWFMEMNTRLQVEHPVTEAITGIDLVEWQLRVAAGESLPARQQDLAIRGHAFEARLYAEDVPAGFLPATGRLTHLQFPDLARVETGVRAGDTISPWYDPMIAKLIVHGPSRAAALNQLARALEQTEVAGSVTNLAFLARLARHPGFAAGDVDTGLIGRDLADLTDPGACPPLALAAAALAGAGISGPGDWRRGFSQWSALRHSLVLVQGTQRLRVTLRLAPGQVWLDLPLMGQEEGASAESQSLMVEWRAGRWWAGSQPLPRALRHDAALVVFPGGYRFDLEDPLALGAGADTAGGGDMVLSPMPGLVKAVFVTPGQEVAEGEKLAILEAMKMEHTLCAPRAGQVAEILAPEGAQVEAGAGLIALRAQEEPAAKAEGAAA